MDPWNTLEVSARLRLLWLLLCEREKNPNCADARAGKVLERVAHPLSPPSSSLPAGETFNVHGERKDEEFQAAISGAGGLVWEYSFPFQPGPCNLHAAGTARSGRQQRLWDGSSAAWGGGGCGPAWCGSSGGK